MKFPVLALAFLVAIRAANAAPPAIAFSGVLVADGKTKVALTDTATGATTWVEPGKDFHGYTLAGYDAKNDSVVLKKNGQEFPLTLVSTKTPTTVAAAPATTPTAAPVPQPNTNTASLTPTGPVTVPTAAAPVTAAPAPTPTVNVAVAPVTPVAAPDPNYITREGDTLTKISAATGLSMDRLKELNPGVNPSAQLDPGNPIRTR
jgi:LysM repeat protein